MDSKRMALAIADAENMCRRDETTEVIEFFTAALLEIS
jgi:hypothetical protein